MGLPALATPAALAAWLGAPVDEARAQAVLSAASTLVRARAGENWVDAAGQLEAGIPDGIPQVVVLVAARAWANPTGTSSTAAAPFSAAWPVGFALTEAEAEMVDAAMGSTPVRGLGTISTTRGPLETGDVWVDVEGGAPLPVGVPDHPTRGPW